MDREKIRQIDGMTHEKSPDTIRTVVGDNINRFIGKNIRLGIAGLCALALSGCGTGQVPNQGNTSSDNINSYETNEAKSPLAGLFFEIGEDHITVIGWGVLDKNINITLLNSKQQMVGQANVDVRQGETLVQRCLVDEPAKVKIVQFDDGEHVFRQPINSSEGGKTLDDFQFDI